MPKVSVYLPDELYAEVRRHDLPISAIAQEALSAALRATANADWINRAQQRPVRADLVYAPAELMSEVDADFGA